MEDENMDISNKGNIVLIVIIISVSILGYIGFISLMHTPGKWNSSCKFQDLSFYPNEIIQIGNTMFFAYEGENITIFKSNDGCDWSEITSPTAGRDIWSSTVEIFKTPKDNLGIVWEETTEEQKSRSSFYWSFFTGTEWSEPQLLFQREEFCTPEDALMLENGALLLLWEEPHIHTYTKEGKTMSVSGCNLLYRAYLYEGELLIEKIMEPTDPILCYSDGHGFIEDGQNIWCIFEHGGYDKTFLYRSWSEDGITWSAPEPFDIQGVDFSKDIINIVSFSDGIKMLSFRLKEKDIFLLQTDDWKHWSKEKIFSTRDQIKGVMLTQGENNMWGFADIGENVFYISSLNEPKNE
jgi:hypothetical protein